MNSRPLASESLETRALLAVVAGSFDEADIQVAAFADSDAAAAGSTLTSTLDGDKISGGACPTCGSAWCLTHLDAAGNAYAALSLPPDGFDQAGDLYAEAPLASPLSDTFLLHSRPGASKRIYLDFNGHTTSGTLWNTWFNGGNDIVTPAFNTDGSSGFSTTELQNIQNIWARVAEDFSPFDVDVTTEEPSVDDLRNSGGSDDRWGIRVVIGANTFYSSAGGVAYLGSFSWNSDTPCFVFNTSTKSVAEAVSHEVGHALGLSHDGGGGDGEYYRGHGTGPTGWSPIMGVGYYTDLSQWSRGEYSEANNQQDDLAIIVGDVTTDNTPNGNGFGYRPDDFGSTLADAYVPSLSEAVNTATFSGVVEQTSDVDVFKFFTLDTLQATINPAAISPNLDILAKILDPTGTVLFTSNPIGSLSASFTQTLAAGYYYLTVEGTGEGDVLGEGYSDYGSLGQYTVSLTVTSDNTPPAMPVILTITDDNGAITGPLAGTSRTDDATLVISGTAEPGSTVEVISFPSSVIATAVADNAGDWSATTSALPEATHSIRVRATDLAGNSTLLSNELYRVTVDLTPPAIPVVNWVKGGTSNLSLGNNAVTRENTLVIGGSAAPGTTVRVFGNGLELGTVTSLSGGEWSFTTAELADGDYTITAKTIDDVGNISAPSVATWQIKVDTQTTAPVITTITDNYGSITGTVASNGTTDDATLTLSGTAEAGSIVKIYDSAALLGQTTATQEGQWTFQTATLPIGLRSFSVTAEDAAGNSETSTADFAVTIDRTAPFAPSIASVVDATGPLTGPLVNGGRTDAASLTFSGFAEAGSSVQVFADAVAVGTPVVADNAGGWSVQINGLTEATHSFTARATDAAGNTSSDTSPPFVVTIDLTAPTVPAITLVNDDQAPQTGPVPAGGFTNDTVLAVSGTADAGVTVQLLIDGAAVANAVADNSGNWSINTPILSVGQHTLTAQALDDVGNASVVSSGHGVTVDLATTVPVVVALADDSGTIQGVLADGDSTDDITPVISGTAEPFSTVEVKVGGVTLGSRTADATGNWSIPLTAQTAGSKTFAITAQSTDRAGNLSGISETLTRTVVIDLTAPSTPSITAITDSVLPVLGTVGNGGFTNDTALLLSGTAEAGSTVSIRRDGQPIAEVVAVDGLWRYETTTLAEGTYSYTVRATDAVGNVSSISGPAYLVTVDTTIAAPVIASLTADSGPVVNGGFTNDTTLLVSGTAEPLSTVRLYANDALIATLTSDGGGDWSHPTAALAQGDYLFTATVTDRAGNLSVGSAAYGVTVDATAPGQPAIDNMLTDSGDIASGGATNDLTPTLIGTAEPNATIEIRRNNQDITGGVGVIRADVEGNFVIDLPSQPQGLQSYEIRAVDAAGNVSPWSAAYTVTVDVVAPGRPTLTSVSDDSGVVAEATTTNDPTLVFVGTAEAESTVRVYSTNGGLIGSAVATSGSFSITSSALVHGNHQFTVTATDAAGNESVATDPPFLLTLDLISNVPLITAAKGTGVNDPEIPSGGATAETTLIISGLVEAGSTVTVTVKASDDTGVFNGNATADGNGEWSVTTGMLTEDTYSITAQATDAAGNISAVSTPPYLVTVDTTAPGSPTILTITDNVGTLVGNVSGGSTNDATPLITGTAEANAIVTLYDNMTVIGQTQADENGSWSLTTTSLADGNYSLTVTATDAAGNVSSASTPTVTLTVDTSAPGVPVVSSVTGNGILIDQSGITNDLTPTLSGTAEQNALVRVFADGVEVGSDSADASGNWTITTVSLTPDGIKSLTVTATDAVGNTSVASLAYVIELDTVVAAPVITDVDDDADRIIGGVANGGLTNDATPTVSGTAEPGSTIVVSSTITTGSGSTTTQVGTTTADPAGNWSVTTSSLAAGTHVLTAVATDPAGNVSVASVGHTVVVDDTVSAPTVTGYYTNGTPITSPTTTNVAAIQIVGNAEPGATVELLNDGNVYITTTADAQGRYEFNTSALPEAVYMLSLRQVDAAGNVSQATAAFSLSIDITAPEAPTIANTASVTNQTSVTLTGNAEANGTVTILRNGSEIANNVPVNGSGAWSYTATNLAHGTTYAFTALVTDAAGNASPPSAAYSVTIDTAAPDAPVIASVIGNGASIAANGRTRATELTLSGTAEAGSSVHAEDNGVPIGAAATADADGNWTITLTGLAEANYSFTAVATDAATNASVDSDAYAVTIDTTAPATPTNVVIRKTDTNGALLNDSAVTNVTTLFIAGDGATNGDTIRVVSGPTVLGTVTATGATWSLSITDLADATYAIQVIASDDVGNDGPATTAVSITIDTAISAPVITAATDNVGSITGGVANRGFSDDQTLTLSGTADPNSTITVRDGGTQIGSTVNADANGNWEFTTPSLAAGSHVFTAVATDAAGNTSAASAIPYTVTIDLTEAAPVLLAVSDDNGPILTNTNPGGTTGDRTLVITGTATPAARVRLYNTDPSDPTKLLGDVVTAADGTWTIATSSLADGTYNFLATATDRAGNVSVNSNGISVVIDTSAPGAPVITTVADNVAPNTSNLNDGDSTNDTVLVISGTAEGNATIALFAGTNQIGTTTADSNGAWSITADALTDGTYSITARATDGTGNESIASAPFTVTIDTVAVTPTIDRVVDDTDSERDVPNGGAANDDTLTLHGTGEPGATIAVSSDQDGSVATATVAADGTWSATTSTLSVATHALTVVATDLAGNVSGASNPAFTVTIDTTAPASAPTFTIANVDGALTNSTSTLASLIISGTGATVGDTVTLFSDNPAAATVIGTAIVAGDGSWQVTTSALAEGDHDITATATDPAGNAGPESGSATTVTIDTVAPAAPTITTAGEYVTATSFALAGTAANDATEVVVYQDGVALNAGSPAPVTAGTWTYSVTGLTDGAEYTFTARAKDAAGNEGSESAGYTVTVDATLPTGTTITAARNGIAVASGASLNTSVITLSGTAEPGSSVTVSQSGSGSATFSPTVTASLATGEWTIEVTGLSEDAHTFTAKATDAAGNIEGTGASITITADRTPPTAPTLASSPTGTTNDNTLALSGTVESGSTVEVFNGSTSLGAATVNGGNWSLTTAPLADGTYSFTAKATDAAGNVSVASAVVSVTVDTVAPAAPAITNTAAFVQDSFVLSGTAEPGSTVAVQATGGMAAFSPTPASVDGNGNWAISVSSLTDAATYTFTITTIDAAGNQSPTTSYSATVDIAAPTGTTITGVAAGPASITDGGKTNATSLTISGTAEVGSTIAVTTDQAAGTFTTAIADASRNWSVTASDLTPNVTHIFTAKATDVAGNEEVTGVTWSVVLDQTAPAAPGTLTVTAASALSDGALTDDNTLTFSGPASAVENNATVRVYMGPTLIGEVTAGADGSWSLTTTDPATLPDGTHAFTATQLDDVGNESSPSTAITITIDTQVFAPFITGAVDDAGAITGNVASGGATDDTSLVLSGTAESGSTVEIFDGNTSLGTVTATGVNWSYTASGLSEGVHNFYAQATDPAGNVSEKTAQPYSVTVDTTAPAAPAITQVMSSAGAVADNGETNDQTLVISGTAAAGVTITILDGGTPIGTTLSGNGTWSFTTPALAAGSHILTVTATDAVGNASGASTPRTVIIDLTPPDAPAITDVQDNQAAILGPVGNTATTNDRTPTISGTTTAAVGSIVTIRSGSTVLGTATVTSGSPNAWSFTPSSNLADGTYSITATVKDAAGNVSPASTPRIFTVDGTAAAPVITAVIDDAGAVRGTVAPNGLTDDATLEVRGTAEPGGTVTLRNGGTILGSVGVSGTGTWALRTSALTSGSISFNATVTDAAGNTSTASNTYAVIVDTIAPVAPAITAVVDNVGSLQGTVANGGTTDDTNLFIRGTAEPGSVVTVRALRTGQASAVTLGTVTAAAGTGEWSIQSGVLADGTYSITAYATDAAGHQSPTSNPPYAVTVAMMPSVVASAPFTTDPGAIQSIDAPVTSVPITFASPVTGFSLSQIRLVVNGRAVSLRGAVLTGTGSRYTLSIPATSTEPVGYYAVEILPGTTVTANGQTLDAKASLFWSRGVQAAPAPAAVSYGPVAPEPAALAQAFAVQTVPAEVVSSVPTFQAAQQVIEYQGRRIALRAEGAGTVLPTYRVKLPSRTETNSGGYSLATQQVFAEMAWEQEVMGTTEESSSTKTRRSSI